MSRDLFLSWPCQGGNQREGGAISEAPSPQPPGTYTSPVAPPHSLHPLYLNPLALVLTWTRANAQDQSRELRLRSPVPPQTAHRPHLSLPVFPNAVLSGWNTFPTKPDLVFTSQLRHHFLWEFSSHCSERLICLPRCFNSMT